MAKTGDKEKEYIKSNFSSQTKSAYDRAMAAARASCANCNQSAEMTKYIIDLLDSAFALGYMEGQIDANEKKKKKAA